MTTYNHTQRGTVLMVTLGVSLVISLVFGIFVTKFILLLAIVLLICFWLFYSLTVSITEENLTWFFGPGLIRKEAPVSEIVSAQIVKTNVLEGWGIHLSRFGWLYNVSGFDAVAITLRDGKRFAIGTDEPHKLIDALEQRIKKSDLNDSLHR